MVREEDVLFVCEKCGFKYEGVEWAERCEEFCAKHNSCSLEITKHAVKE